MTGSQVTALLELANARHGPGAHGQPPAQEHDHLASAEEARSYLSEQGLELPPGLPTGDELARLREIADLPFAFDRLPESVSPVVTCFGSTDSGRSSLPRKAGTRSAGS
jgi:hypothetical protein